MGKMGRKTLRNATYPWDKKTMDAEGTLTIPGDLGPIPKRSGSQPAKDSFNASTDVHLEGSLKEGATLAFMSASTGKDKHHTVTIDGDVRGALTVWGDTAVKIGGSVYGKVYHFGTGDITVDGDVHGYVSGKGTLTAEGTIHKSASLGYEIKQLTAHSIEEGTTLPVPLQSKFRTTVPFSIVTETPREEPEHAPDPLAFFKLVAEMVAPGIKAVLDNQHAAERKKDQEAIPTEGVNISDKALPPASIDPAEGGPANKRGKER